MRIPRLRLFFLCAVWLSLFALPLRAEEGNVVRIGVSAVNGKESALREWGALAHELQKALPGKSFEIVPLAYDELEDGVINENIQFVLLGPTYYVDLEVRRGISRIATLVRSSLVGPVHSLGGVVVVRSDRKDIAEPKDLKGKNIVATNQMTLGGWLSQMRELRRLGILPKDFKSVSFQDNYNDTLIALLEGKADAAFVRTGTIEGLMRDGRIAHSEVRVLRFASAPLGYPFEISTATYPEWAFAKTVRTPDDLAKKVALALLSLPANSPLRKSAGVEGFTVPLDYAPVHELLRENRMGPYANLHEDSLAEALTMHGRWLLVAGAAFLVLSGAVFGLAALNRRLAQSRAQTLRMRDELENEVAMRTRDLEAEVERRRLAEVGQSQNAERIKDSLVKTVKAVALTVEMRDPYMSGHQQRVAVIAKRIAEEMELAPLIVESIYLSGLVHDIGMIYVPSEITNRPGPLSDLEFEIVRTHPQIGHDIMSTVDLPWPIADIVLNHHRFVDGTGYPADIEGEIPLEARILRVADCVEAMCAHRPYRPPLGLAKALAEIDEGKGTRYDPDVADVCLKLIGEKGAFWK
jgi:HD-GYP domain-containing protein (c-di-GMP phosphodiesterase class II)/ABC-type phosphate/phosphonate transport system substrate-binding protein